jgi:predicted unusual protein kinase regulating ubiquinone biosynthesis (AarF/ABC1/UbiB family)
MKKIKTGPVERKMAMARASVVATSRWLGRQTTSAFVGKERRARIRREAFSREVQYLVEELGKLKGSVVKAGQMMALYGEHLLPEEVTAALHTLEDQTVALDWPVMERILRAELGDLMDELDIDPVPLGAASLGQVHKALLRAEGQTLCLKVQYPGVAEAIDSDVNTIARLLKLTRVVRSDKTFELWLDDVREMLRHEVDYDRERKMTERFHLLLQDDPHFVVPGVLSRFSTGKVLATTFEPGLSPTDARVMEMPVARRSQLGYKILDLFLRELFEWKTMQTDPNFGNYRIRLSDNEDEPDQLVLLDFGAVQDFPDSFVNPCQKMVMGGFQLDHAAIDEGALALHMMDESFPASLRHAFTELCISMMEPFEREGRPRPPETLNANSEYRWGASNLPKRVAKQATKTAMSRHFRTPPKEFVFLTRKLMGVYTFIAVLDSEFNCNELLERYL